MGSNFSSYAHFESFSPSQAWCGVYYGVTLRRSVMGQPEGRTFHSCVVDLSGDGYAHLMSARSSSRPLLTIPLKLTAKEPLVADTDDTDACMEEAEEVESDEECDGKRQCLIIED